MARARARSFLSCHNPRRFSASLPRSAKLSVKKCNLESFLRRVSSNFHLGIKVFAGLRKLLVGPKHHGLRTTISTSLSFVVSPPL
jgi:hypothetical protein